MKFGSIRAGRALVLLTLVASIAAPAHALTHRKAHGYAAALHAAPPGTIVVSGPAHTVDRPARMPSEYFTNRDIRKVFDRETLIAAERKALESSWHIRFTDPAAEVGRLRAARAAGAPGPGMDTFTIESLYRAGDLDGDGRIDLISQKTTIQVDFMTGSYSIASDEIDALRGVNGDLLWKITTIGEEAGFALPVNDLTGAGHSDVMLVKFTLDSVTGPNACAAIACAIAEQASWHWTLSALAGTMGTALWSQTFPGSGTAAGALAVALVAVGEAFALTETNAVVQVASSADHNSDGGADLVINAFDDRQILGAAGGGVLVGAEAVAYEPLVATHSVVANGADGKTIFARSADYQPGGAQLLVAGHTVESSGQDLLWSSDRHLLSPYACAFAITGACGFVEHSDLSLEMINGSTLATAWTSTIGDPTTEEAFVFPLLTDLSGDGKDDILLGEYSGTAANTVLQQGVISGANGNTLWLKPASDFFVPGGSMAGKPFLLGFNFYFNDDRSFTTILNRVDGATGAALLTSKHDYAPNTYNLFIYPLGDANGDQATDVVFDSLVVDGSGVTEVDTSSAFVESGADGSKIWNRELNGFAFTEPAGDVNGDKRADLYDNLYDQSLAKVTVNAVTLPSGMNAWSRTDSFASNTFFAAAVGIADTDGDGGTEAAYFRTENLDSAGRFTRTDILASSSGNALWGFGDTLPTVAPTLGSIGGVVSDSKGPLAGICVSAFESGGSNFGGYAQTDAQGTYTVSNLPDATYVVQFDDCGAGTYNTQYYNGKSKPIDADILTIAGGASLTGINAIMVAIPPLVFNRTETKSYIVGLAGDQWNTGPLPGGVVNDCTGSGPSIGGTCFQLKSGDRAAQFRIADDSGSQVGGSYSFTDATLPIPNTITTGTFCGSSKILQVPPQAVEVYVFTGALATQNSCGKTAVPLTGSMSADFSQ